MKENDAVLGTVTKPVASILLIFGFYVFSAGHNNPGGGFIGGLIFGSAFILMSLAFNVEEVLENLPIGLRILTVIDALVSPVTMIVPTFFGKPFLSQYETTLTLPILGYIHVMTIAPFELGTLFSVVGAVVTVMLSLSGGRS